MCSRSILNPSRFVIALTSFKKGNFRPSIESIRNMSRTSEVTPLKQSNQDEKPVVKLFNEKSKIYELRQYNLNPIQMPEYLKLTNERLHLRTNHSKLIGFWSCELGGLNQSIHIWEYDNLQHRTKVRTALSVDNAWQKDYIKEAIPKITSQDNSVIVPFSWGEIQTPTTKGVYELQTLNMTSHIDVWHDRLKKVVDKKRNFIADFNSKLVGAFYTVFGKHNTVVLLWQHESFDKAVEGKMKILTEDKDPTISGFYHEVDMSVSKGMQPVAISPMQ